jgi:hypothetical protein
MAIMLLLDDLETKGLEIIKRETQKKLIEKKNQKSEPFFHLQEKNTKGNEFDASMVIFTLINLLFIFNPKIYILISFYKSS